MIPPGWRLSEAERVRLVAPFGVRFWDTIFETVVGEGLVVEMYLDGRPNERVTVRSGPSGVFAPRGLPGLAKFEAGEGGVRPRKFVVDVTDSGGRFVPFSLTTKDLPDVLNRLFELPPFGTLVPLFSAPARPVPAGMAVVRAHLVRADMPGSDPTDPETQAPGAWAVLEVTPPSGKTAYGMADERGRVAVVFPYPDPSDPMIGSPPGLPSPPAGSTQPTDRKWPVGLAVRFAPLDPVPDRRDLERALAQGTAKLWADSTMATQLTSATLRYGEELILRTAVAGSSPPKSNAELFITLT